MDLMLRIASRTFYLIVLTLITALLWNRIMHETLQPTSVAGGRRAIVVGSGLAGLSAASQLVEHNVPVTMLERAAKPGGNSIKASSGINGAPTKYQPVPDNLFYTDTVKSAGSVFSNHQRQRDALISTLTDTSSEAIAWLTEEKEIDLSKVAQLGGHSRPRTHRGAGKLPPGAAIVTTLLKQLQQSPLFDLKTSCHATKILKEGSRVSGIEYDCGDGPKTLNGAAILTAGGFGGDTNGLLAKYRPDLAGIPSTNDPRPGSHSLLTDVGAQLLDMELVQIHPTGFVDPQNLDTALKFLAAEALRGEGGILLKGGRRFVNEMETREYVSDKIMEAEPSGLAPIKQWDVQLLLDEGSYSSIASHVDFYLFKGLMRKTTLKELEPNVVTTLREYAGIVGGKLQDPFGRTAFGNWTLSEATPDSIVYIGRVTPVVHFTMGGAVINEKAEILDTNRKPIEGLWAAGEITGGIHGENRLGGSSLLECVVFGRIAGDQAASRIANIS